jgi:hypothetical protein
MARISPKLADNLAAEFAHYKEVQRQLLLTIEILFAERDMLRYWLIENAERDNKAPPA